MNPTRDLYPNTEAPSLFWRSLSHQVIFSSAAIARAFLFVFNKTEVHGLAPFLDLINSRADYGNRRRGLLTVSNHISVLDDPLMWGALPLSFAAVNGYMNQRWSFASHDICFKSGFLSHFFTLGQTLPTHRLAHSPHGGIAQPTLTEGVRLLSKIHARSLSWNPHITSSHPYRQSEPASPSWPHDCIDPFSDMAPPPSYPSGASDPRTYLAPSRYASNSYAWVHIFPEGRVHQSGADKAMRYFKWGVARLILEPAECPDVVPIFIEGLDDIMDEARGFPRFVPRVAKTVHVSFGARVDTESVFGDLRKRWREIRDREYKRRVGSGEGGAETCPEGMVGVLWSEEMIRGEEVLRLRKECTTRLRQEVLKLRRQRGYPDEDPKAGLVETYIREGPKREGRMLDDTWVKDV